MTIRGGSAPRAPHGCQAAGETGPAASELRRRCARSHHGWAASPHRRQGCSAMHSIIRGNRQAPLVSSSSRAQPPPCHLRPCSCGRPGGARRCARFLAIAPRRAPPSCDHGDETGANPRHNTRRSPPALHHSRGLTTNAPYKGWTPRSGGRGEVVVGEPPPSPPHPASLRSAPLSSGAARGFTHVVRSSHGRRRGSIAGHA